MGAHVGLSNSVVPDFIDVGEGDIIAIATRHRVWKVSDIHQNKKTIYADVTLVDGRRVVLYSQYNCDGQLEWSIGHMLEHTKEHDNWERPAHYGGEENPFEPIKIIEYYDLNFNEGNAIKYILRAALKEKHLEDLKKAYTYIGFEIRRLEKQ